jgi:hypothetical protein
MATYLLVESRSPWETGDAGFIGSLSKDLQAQGHDVTVYLVQNGVLPARRGARDTGLADLAATVRVFADDFSLRERAIGADALVPGVRPAAIETVVELLARGARALWH